MLNILRIALVGVVVAGGCSNGDGPEECVPEHQLTCWPEPGPGAQVRWLDSCAEPGQVVDECLGTHVECREAACLCLNHWEGEECTRCPDNWDQEQDCAVCRNRWIDEDNDCGTCPGNWDPDSDCSVCRNRWIDQDNDCATCPPNWDPTKDCAECLVGWTGENCQQVALGCSDYACSDYRTTLSWQRNSTSTVYDWYWADQFCQNLELDGRSDWRLPNITELRTLVRGCPSVQAGGACPVNLDCLSQDCHDATCTPTADCPAWNGPGELGCYWPAELTGDCDLSHWSSSMRSDDDRRVWDLRFRDAYLSWSTKDSQQVVRCVRTLVKY